MSWFQEPSNSPLNPAATEFIPPPSHINGKTKPIQWSMEQGYEADDPSSNVLNGKLSFEDQYAFLWGDEKQKSNTPEDQPQFSEEQFSFLWEEQLSLDQIKNIPIANNSTNAEAQNTPKKEPVEEGHTFLWEKGRNSLKGSSSGIPIMPGFSENSPSNSSSTAPMPIKQNGNNNVKTIPFVLGPSNLHNSNGSHKRNNSNGGNLGGSFSLTFGTPPTSTSPTPNGFGIQPSWGKEVGSPSVQSNSWKPPSKTDAKLIPNLPGASNSWDGTRSQAIPVKPPVNKEVYSYNSLDKSVGSPSSPKFPVQFSPEKITFLQNLSSSPADMNAIKMNPIEFLESIFIGCDREFLLQALEVNEFDIKKTTQYLLRGMKNPEEAAMIISSTPPLEKPPVKVPEQPKKKKQDEQAPVCKYFLKGSCLIKNCPFRHTTEVACKYWLRGFCSRGDQCDYKHSVDIAAINRVFEGIEEVSTGDYREGDKNKISLSQQEFPSLKNVSKK